MQHQDNITINEVVQTLRSEESDKNIKKKKLFAIIIDAARPKQLATTQDYMQTIKIIDSSYNGFMTLFYFCKSLEDCAPIDSIGEIVLLKRYHYQLYNNEPQAKRNAFKTSQLLLFGLEDLELKFNPNDSRQLSDEELNSLKSLQIFGIHHLTNFSLTKLFWYNNSNIYDVLLKIEKYDENTVYLLDSNHQTYSLVSSTIAESHIPIGTIVKLRSISISLQNEIQIHEFSSLLLVPQFAYDTCNFDKLDQQIVKIDISADTYIQYNPKSITKIKKKWAKAKPSLIRDILDESLHLVQAEIVGISPTSLKDALVYYNITNSFTYSQAIEQNINIQGMSSTINVQIQLNQNNQIFTVHLIKNDEFFNFDQIDAENIEILNNKYQQILQKILLNDEPVYADLVIQLLPETQQNIYRIVDTQIQP